MGVELNGFRYNMSPVTNELFCQYPLPLLKKKFLCMNSLSLVKVYMISKCLKWGVFFFFKIYIYI